VHLHAAASRPESQSFSHFSDRTLLKIGRQAPLLLKLAPELAPSLHPLWRISLGITTPRASIESARGSLLMRARNCPRPRGYFVQPDEREPQDARACVYVYTYTRKGRTMDPGPRIEEEWGSKSRASPSIRRHSLTAASNTHAIQTYRQPSECIIFHGDTRAYHLDEGSPSLDNLPRMPSPASDEIRRKRKARDAIPVDHGLMKNSPGISAGSDRSDSGF